MQTINNSTNDNCIDYNNNYTNDEYDNYDYENNDDYYDNIDEYYYNYYKNNNDDTTNQLKKINGYRLEHTYKDIDNWDGSFCGNYCIGCSKCDHFPMMYAIDGYEQRVKHIEYYCKECFDTEDNTSWAKMFGYDTPKCANDDPNKIVDLVIDPGLSVDILLCKECKKIINTPECTAIKNYRYYTRTVCSDCGKCNKLSVVAKERTDINVFHCESCNAKYKVHLNNIDTDIIKCENISRINEFRRTELKISVNGEISHREIRETV